MGPKNSRFGAFIKILKVAFDCQSPCQQLCPRAYFFKMTPQQVKFTRISEKIDKIITIDFNGQIEMMLRDFLRYPSVFKKSVRGKMFLFYRNLKLCPRENFIKMLPEGAILWVRKTPVLGHL